MNGLDLDRTVNLSATSRAWAALESVMDPEIPVLSLIDLGVIRSVEWLGDELQVGVSPTYSGCPATRVIRDSVLTALHTAGFARVNVLDVLSPPWSSDWISEQGRCPALGLLPPEGR